MTPVGEGDTGGRCSCRSTANKKSVTLDPMTPEGRRWSRSSSRPPTSSSPTCRRRRWKAMKLDYESLKAIKPDIILTTATAFGDPGRWSGLRRLRRNRTGHVGRGLHDRAGDPPIAPPSTGRFRHGAALRLRHAGRADGTRQDRARQIVEGALLATARRLHQRNADRAGGDLREPRSDRQSRTDDDARPTSIAPRTAGCCAR